MWSKMPKVFWFGLLLIYGNAALWWILEAANPNLPKTFVAGAPAAFWYACIWSLLVLNVFIAWLFSR